MLNYTFNVSRGIVTAYNPKTESEVWRRCLRTYFRDPQKKPHITLQVSDDKVIAFWMGTTILINAKTGKVEKHIRSMIEDGGFLGLLKASA